jgi:hypothetical protein
MLEYTRYPDDDFTWFVLTGETPIAAWLETVRRYGSEGMTRYELYDLRSRATPFSTEEIEQIVHQTIQDMPLRPPGGKTAIVVKETLKFGLVRMYETFAELEGIATETRPFYDMAEAAQWLGDSIANLPGLVSSAPTVR